MAHNTPIDVRFADIDHLGHVNNAKYLTYIEHARLCFVDEILPNIDWEKEGFILARAEVNFMRPIILHDKVAVETWCSRMGSKSFDLSYRIVKESTDKTIEMANALTVLVAYDYKEEVAIPVLDEWRDVLGEHMI